jgi:hypothetical protein
MPRSKSIRDEDNRPPELLRIRKDTLDSILTEKKFKCRLCGESFSTAAERDEHNRHVHPKAYRLSHLFSGKRKEDKPKAEYSPPAS